MLFKEINDLKRHIGYMYASLEFDNFKTDLELASADMKRMIGADTYNLAQTYFDANGTALPETPTAFDNLLYELLLKIQLPVALYAYAAYAPNADVTHSDKGRQIFVSEHEKPAFEWQLERDENATINRANRATDELLRWLDENTLAVTPLVLPMAITAGKLYSSESVIYFAIAGRESTEGDTLNALLEDRVLSFIYRGETPDEWVDQFEYLVGDIVGFGDYAYKLYDTMGNDNPDTGAAYWARCEVNAALMWEYKQSTNWVINSNLFINHADEFDRVFPIEKSYRLFNILSPFIKEAERTIIIPIVGKERSALLKQNARSGALTDEDEELLDFIKPALVLLTMHKAVRRLNSTLLPDGLLRVYAESGNSSRGSVSKSLRDTAALAFEKDANEHIAALQIFLAQLTATETNTTYVPDPVVPANDEDNNFFRV